MEWFVLMDDLYSGRVFYIDNYVVYISPNWSISDKINARTTMQAKIVDLNELLSINVGDSVKFENSGTVIFAGIIQTIDISEEGAGYLVYNIKCVDNSALADKILIAETGSNETAGYIVENVILPYLADEGVTAGTIEAGVTISKYTFNYIKCSMALDQIKTITGLNWNIDNNKQLNLWSNGSLVSPWTLTATTQHRNFRKSASLNQYRNVQYVRAGKGKTALQTDEKPSPKPDGVSRTFNLKYPLAEKPIITINSVAIDPTDIGVIGLSTDKKYYFSYNSNAIIQDDTETILTDTDVVEVTYTGLYDILVQAENEDEIDARKSVEEGTSGRYENITEEKSITESDEAAEFGAGLLTKYGEVADNITFSTEVSGLEAGQLLTVNKPLYNLSDSFLIESINIKSASPQTLEYVIKALDGASLGGWEEYFKEILRTQKTYVINENESLIKLRKFTDVVTVSDALTFDEDTDMGTEVVTVSELFTATDTDGKFRVDINEVGFGEVG